MRLYAIQVHDTAAGWQDVPNVFPAWEEPWSFKKEHEASRVATHITQQTKRATRVQRKPHGWEP